MDNIVLQLENQIKRDLDKPKIYSKTLLSNNINRKLLSYQKNHVVKLINILIQKWIAIDTSDTGIGKTYIAAAICRELNRKPVVICPKTLIYNWISVLEFYGVKAYDVVNYETIKNGKTYSDGKFKTRKKSKYIEIADRDPDDPLNSAFNWQLPDDAIVIFDEVHRCKDPQTENGKLLISSKNLIQKHIPVLLLSATICEEYSDMKIPFYLMNFIPNTRNFNHYIRTLKNKYPKYRIHKSDYSNTADCRAAKENSQAMIIHDEIKDFTSRIRIKDLGDQFPSNQWCAQEFFTENSQEIAEAYAEIAQLLDVIKQCEDNSEFHLAKIQKLKQQIELRKVPIFIEQSEFYLEEGKSVIIFVNYLNTFDVLCKELNIKCQIYGKQTTEQRQESIDLFQNNQERIIICQVGAGGTGLSLHDLHGNHPRVTLISLPDSASGLIQALGRAPRAQAKTPVLQRIVIAANVDYEKHIMRSINKKLANISAINDGDIDGNKYAINKGSRKKNNK
ncbi:ATP-dependent RNA helicase [Acanthamoeba polyphaga mimivirus]|uniref:ATP-dependent RNA helicase n=3 Tax=Megamimivirinae TaxID=3044648 RepID=A0A2L2DJB1_MIMIV|nr:putative ATP-dependent RNA helicase [Megavirus chiliensis]AEQ32407.1 putative ATP-dependent RNA helicase [Megavirus chiliensis]AGD92458.1 putative ATP-dependent RNA helicase [Megavirus lba]AVG46262.1 ATP-dependent RNA helicase [Acanthamoeba polyphaga mimivirus]AVG47372.1 ATP-dependent RNA helicase [Acanthamoeba polyphaga mimivirus]